MRMPVLTTERLSIRPFVMDDLDAIHHILDVELNWTVPGNEPLQVSIEERRAWLQWSVLNYEQLAELQQPPYGDRAIVLADDDTLIGACGFVPDIKPFELLPSYSDVAGVTPEQARSTPEVGLYYALSPRHRGRGYATEAARALITFAFDEMRLQRIIATTSYDNSASVAVMRRLGMRIDHNPFPEPHYLQVVGILDHPGGGRDVG